MSHCICNLRYYNCPRCDGDGYIVAFNQIEAAEIFYKEKRRREQAIYNMQRYCYGSKRE